MVSTKPLFSLLDRQVHMLAIDAIVLIVGNSGQYRVSKKTFTKFYEAGWLALQWQSGDIAEYELTDAGRVVAARLKAHNEDFIQLSLWAAERAKQEQQQLF